MSAEQTPDIERVLAEHAWAGTHGPSTDEHPLGRLSQCRCGWTDDYDLDPFGPWRAHVAQALAPVLAAAVREALVEAADEAEALKTPSQGNNPQSHAFVIGYGTARRLIVRQLRDRADWVAEPQHETATSGKESED